MKVKYNDIGIPMVSTNFMYKSLGLLQLEDIYRYSIGIFNYSILYGNNNHLFDVIFLPNVPLHDHNTRHNGLNLPIIGSERERQSTAYSCVKYFNLFPSDLYEPMSIHSFKRKIKAYLLQRYE